MESGWSSEQKTLISELIQGMELAKQLKANLHATSSVETGELLVQKILSSYEKSLFILKWSGSMGQQQTPVGVTVTASVPESPLSMNGSPRSDDFDGGNKENLGYNGASKKRKATPRWTDQVRVSSENALEGPHEDGYSWRKYGQKDILGAKYPRSYYRCTYRNTQNCWATKQVQRSDEDPTIFDVTYRGIHTCSHGTQPIPPPASPEKQEQKQNSNYRPQQSQEALFSYKGGDTVDFDNKEIVSPFSFPSTYEGVKSLGSYSPSFISPATPEPNYHSISAFRTNDFGGAQNFQLLDSDFTDIITANTSATNSPIVDLDFSHEQLEFDPNFPFGIPAFFS